MNVIKDIDIMKVIIVILAIVFGLFGLINGWVAFLLVLSSCSLTITLPEKKKSWMEKQCPVCQSTNIKLDEDFPDTMQNCLQCSSEWVFDSDVPSFFDITYNSKEHAEAVDKFPEK